MADQQLLLNVKLNVTGSKDLRNLAAQLDRSNRALKQTAGELPKASRAYKTTATNTKALGFAARNASFQIQDFIVQTSNGTSAVTALGQQLPQLLGPLGNIGAAAALAASLIPVAIRLVTEWGEETVTLAEATDAFNEAINKVDLDGYIKKLEEGTEKQKDFALAQLEFANDNAIAALDDVSKAVQQIASDFTELAAAADVEVGFIGLEDEAGLRGAQNALISGQQRLAEEYGLTIDQYNELVPLFRQASREQFRNAETLTQLVDAFPKGTQNKQLAETVKRLNELNAASEKVAKTNRAIADARSPLQEIPLSGREQIEPTQFPSPKPDQNDDLVKYNDEVARTQALFAQFNPEIAAFQQGIIDITEAQAKGVVTTEQFNAEVTRLNATLSAGELPEIARELGRELPGVIADTSEQFSLLQETTDIFSDSFDTFTNGVIQGTTDIEDAFENMAKGIIAQLAKLALQAAITSAFPGITFSAKGNVFQGGQVQPFAKGGVVDKPTIFPMANGGVGVMSEAGPEAIMPLGRNSRGELGVKGGGVNVTVNNNVAGADVQVNDTGNGITIDVIEKLVANSIITGGNGISKAMERTYSVSRGRGVY